MTTGVDNIGSDDFTWSGTPVAACPLVRPGPCSVKYPTGAQGDLPANTHVFRPDTASWSWLTWVDFGVIAAVSGGFTVFEFGQTNFPQFDHAASWFVGLDSGAIKSVLSVSRGGATLVQTDLARTLTNIPVGSKKPHLIGISYDAGAQTVEVFSDGASQGTDATPIPADFSNFPNSAGWTFGRITEGSFAATRMGHVAYFPSTILDASDHAALWATRHDATALGSLIGSLGAANYWPLDEFGPDCPCPPENGWKLGRIGLGPT